MNLHFNSYRFVWLCFVFLLFLFFSLLYFLPSFLPFFFSFLFYNLLTLNSSHCPSYRSAPLPVLPNSFSSRRVEDSLGILPSGHIKSLCGWAHPPVLRPAKAVLLEKYITQRDNTFWDRTLSIIFRTHVMTKLHICYICMWGIRSSPCVLCLFSLW